MKKRFGWTVWGIVGLVFASVSLVFIPVGLVVDAAKPGEYGRVFLYVFVGMGAFFLILGLAFLSADLRRRYLLRRAWYGGNAVAAKVTGVRSVNNVSMNGRHPVVLECEYQGNVYRSRYLYRDVPETGSEVTVYIDRIDDRIGFVDIP